MPRSWTWHRVGLSLLFKFQRRRKVWKYGRVFLRCRAIQTSETAEGLKISKEPAVTVGPLSKQFLPPILRRRVIVHLSTLVPPTLNYNVYNELARGVIFHYSNPKAHSITWRQRISRCTFSSNVFAKHQSNKRFAISFVSRKHLMDDPMTM